MDRERVGGKGGEWVGELVGRGRKTRSLLEKEGELQRKRVAMKQKKILKKSLRWRITERNNGDREESREISGRKKSRLRKRSQGSSTVKPVGESQTRTMKGVTDRSTKSEKDTKRKGNLLRKNSREKPTSC